jgi:small subunit ribosomal protein S16
MAVHLRLSRAGAKKAPYYHIVAADSRSPRDGAFLEQVGTYNPGTEAATFDAAALEKWIKNGAVPTVTVRNLLKKHKPTTATTEA